MLFIHGIGHFHPDTIINNQFFEDLKINAHTEWILERVGIHERRTTLPLSYIRQTYNQHPEKAILHATFTNAETGAKATQMALERANITANQIGLVIAGGCLPQHAIPADACIIAAKLGINAPAFDLNSACSTFVVQMHFINQMQAETLPDYILLIMPENMTRSINYRDRSTAILWGDCSTAIIVSKKIRSNVAVTCTMIHSDPNAWQKIVVPNAGHFYQEGSIVQKFAIKKSIEMINQLREKSGIRHDQHFFIGHQANLSMLKTICKHTQVADEKHKYNVDQFGNCGAAGAPSVLSQCWPLFTSTNNTILLTTVGAGLTWGGMIINVL